MVWQSPCKPWELLDENERVGARWFWTHGDLRYKLDPLQKHVRRKIDDYFAQFDGSGNSFARLYIEDMARRLGKDFINICKMLEELRKRRDGIYSYGTATREQVTDILEPILKIIMMDCPPHLRLLEKTSRHRWIHPITGSVMKLVGLDKDPDGMRGPRCDGVVLTEVPFCRNFEDAEQSFLPQLVDNPEAWRIYGSSAGKDMSHKWETEIVPEARIRGNYSHHIFDESPRYTPELVEAAYDELGGRDSHEAQRELQCKHQIPLSDALIPEWSAAKAECVVDSYPRPEVAHGYIGLDPGHSDLAGIPAGYLDYANDMLVIERAEAEPGLNTEELALLIKDIEGSLEWYELRDDPRNFFGYYAPDGRKHRNPYRRVSDRDPRLIDDLQSARDENGKPFGLSFEPAIKHDLHTGIKMLRTRIARRKIRIIRSKCQKLIAHLDSALWNEKRTEPKRTSSKLLGHFDLVMALVYLNRSIDETVNPFNPVRTYPQNYHVVEPIVKPVSGWHRERDQMGNFS